MLHTGEKIIIVGLFSQIIFFGFFIIVVITIPQTLLEVFDAALMFIVMALLLWIHPSELAIAASKRSRYYEAVSLCDVNQDSQVKRSGGS
ncbi:hypothetical protein diail_6636 [Diaporthe ilicicola]|nr:hypothetical protein diail_6636 [Diaporthe ilicicola]